MIDIKTSSEKGTASSRSTTKGRVFAFTRQGEVLYDDGRLVSLVGSSVTLPPPLTAVVEAKGQLAYGGQGNAWVIRRNRRLLTGALPHAPSCAPYGVGQRVYIGDVEKTLYCLEESGRIRWSIPVEAPVSDIRSTPGGKLIILLASGWMFILEGDR